MIELNGKNGQALVYTDLIEETAIGQIIQMLNHPITEHTEVRIMPDVHAGKGATIGTTIQLSDDKSLWKVSPNITGVDLGCGMMSYRLYDKHLDLPKIDDAISKHVPSGHSVHQKAPSPNEIERLLEGLTFDLKKPQHILNSLGTLGGGNHFIEVAQDDEGYYWLTVHSGSRNLGVQVATHHQNKAIRLLNDGQDGRKALIDRLKRDGLAHLIEQELQKQKQADDPYANRPDLAYLSDSDLDDYLSDVKIAQTFAHLNRKAMLDNIVKHAGLSIDPSQTFDSVHNYIDVEKGIIRKGATDASEGLRLIIPLNMRDGSLICVGKGNTDWNFSAPHGAGRILSRSQAKKELSIDQYVAQMENVYTTSVGAETLDEAPNAYKPMDAIIDNIGDTVDILHHIKPVYNYKAH